jgi:hypothetical protein
MLQPPQGVKISAYIFFALAALNLLVTCILMAVIGLGAANNGTAEDLAGAAIGLCFVVVFIALYAAVGYGLLKMQGWARIAAIVLAILSLCSFPIGTILGGVVLYFMFQQETTQAFQ